MHFQSECQNARTTLKEVRRHFMDIKALFDIFVDNKNTIIKKIIKRLYI